MHLLDKYLSVIVLVALIALFLSLAVSAVVKGSILLGAINLVSATCFVLPLAIHITEKRR